MCASMLGGVWVNQVSLLMACGWLGEKVLKNRYGQPKWLVAIVEKESSTHLTY